VDDSSIGLLGGKLDDYDDVVGICKDNLSFLYLTKHKIRGYSVGL
jgi:hypothetical protein